MASKRDGKIRELRALVSALSAALDLYESSDESATDRAKLAEIANASEQIASLTLEAPERLFAMANHVRSTQTLEYGMQFV